MKKTFVNYRKKIYASINGTKGNLVKLSKSSLLSKSEKEKLDKVIEALENLRVEYNNNRGIIKRYNFDCWGRDGLLKTEIILALSEEDAIAIFESKYPDKNFDKPYT